jgi:hypothetical protein
MLGGASMGAMLGPLGMLLGGAAGSGFVSGEKGVDKVPAMLSDGEFVMSTGAVQKYGVDTLEAMNAAGGGTNKPKIMNGTTYAAGGGLMGDVKEKVRDPILEKREKTFGKFVDGRIEERMKGRSKNRGLSTRGVQSGFTGMGKEGFDAISSGDKFKLGKFKPQILGRGAYSAPTFEGAQRYAGTSGSLGGRQTAGGVIKTIVPGNAPRINFLEPQARVAPKTFDKGKILADKLLSGEYSNSPLANKLRDQLTGGSAKVQRINTNMNVPGGRIRGGSLSAIMSAFEIKQRKDEGQTNVQAGLGVGGSVLGGQLGWMGGAKAGAVAGAALGSIVPGLGTGVGAAVGAIVGGLAGGYGGGMLGGKLADDISGVNAKKERNNRGGSGNLKDIQNDLNFGKKSTQIAKTKPKNVRGVRPSAAPKPKVVYGPPAPQKRNVRGGGTSTKTPSFSATTNGMRSKQETLGLMR